MGNEDERTLARQIERWLNEGGRDVDEERTRDVLAQRRSPNSLETAMRAGINRPRLNR